MSLTVTVRQIKKKEENEWDEIYIEYSNCVIENMRWILWSFIKTEPLCRLMFSLLITNESVVWFR